MTIQHLKLAAWACTARSKKASFWRPASGGVTCFKDQSCRGFSSGLPRVACRPISRSRRRCMRETRSSPAPQAPSSGTFSSSCISASYFFFDGANFFAGRTATATPRRNTGTAAKYHPSRSSSSSSVAWSWTRVSRMARSAGSKQASRSSVGCGAVAAAKRANVAATTPPRSSCASGPRTLSTSLANCFSVTRPPAAGADRARRVRTSSAALASRRGTCVASSVRVGTAHVQTSRSGSSCVLR
mmetsp:Transcript_22459/g.77010  ORF Transcript_22459/g.77010 Transcript_22459/m.77010 type:complete len:243 (-) Transcript_22459:2722-3450(-)